ncbi:MAG: rod shape-determining protein MreC [Clostridia bacterium]|nr:rod shape-determining protein MreC [Clostridia bacterium]
MKFFKSKFFIITLIVAVSVAAVFTAMSLLGYSSLVKSALHYITLPAQKLADTVGRAVDGYTAYFSEVERIKRENEELRAQIDEMLDEVQSAKAVREENEELRRMLEVKQEHLDYKFEPVDVIGREDGNYMTVFTLGKGKKNGIERDMPIIASNNGLIGRITDAGETWAKADSIIDMGSSVGAFVERSRASGIVVGEYELGLKGLCKLSYLQSDADIEVGDRILTSGVGSVYPRGLIIGTVTEVKYDEGLRTKYAIIKPYAQISGLSSVMVVTSFEKYVEE